METKIPFLNLLSQNTLKEIEEKCTQEQPPGCEAACPMHVEAREMVHKIKGQDFSGAYELYAKRIPFPGLMAKICDAPCKSQCKRGALGGAIEIQLLEKAVLAYGAKQWKAPPFLPRANKKVLIAGGGLSGMTAAFDLARKGFAVTILEKESRPGSRLWLQEELSDGDITLELEKLRSLKVQIRPNETVNTTSGEELQHLLEAEGADALFIACKGGIEPSNPATLETSIPGIFAAGLAPDISGASIYAMFSGRCAATSMDRYLKNVSLTAGREQEGSFETRLYTNLSNIPAFAPVLPQDAASLYTPEEAFGEARRCIDCQCLECVKGCAFMQYYNSYPKKLARETYNNLSIAMGTRIANKMIGTCNLCGQCGELCPNGLSMKEVFWSARKTMADTEKMPQSYHEFALLDTDYSNSDSFFTIRHQKGHEKSAYAFFPSCQLAASEPKLADRMYEDLSDHLNGGVGLMLGCCGVMAYWSGQEDRFFAVIEKLKAGWESLGKPTIITACPTCLQTLKEYGGMPVTGIWDLWQEQKFTIPSTGGKTELAVYDPCAARYEKTVQESVRNLALKAGYTLREPVYAKETAACCGYGGLTPYVDRAVAGAITKTNAEKKDLTYLTYCINCRDRFLGQGKESLHIGEILYPDVVLNHRSPTLSERQINRRHLKETLLKKYWGVEKVAQEECKLYIEEVMETVLDQRMILHSDIRQAILHGEESRESFLDVKTGRLITGYRMGNVTFWIVYSPEEDGFRVHDAYSHRMTIG